MPAYIWIPLIVLAVLMLLFVGTVLTCFLLVFYVPKRTKWQLEQYDIPPMEIFLKYKDMLIAATNRLRARPCKDFEVKSFDGLTLRAKYYEVDPDAPIEIMMHGYRGRAERDFGLGVERCFMEGHNALLIDQRASGYSDGHIITFGIRESRDCRSWIDLLIKTFGDKTKIILTGVSMGASTALMAAGTNLPKNVVGVIADCGYTTAEVIIKKVIKQLKLPVKVVYPFVKLGAKWFGRFDIDAASALDAVKNCKIPVAFIHGEQDTFVPYEMTLENYKACPSPKELLLVKNADHVLSFVEDEDGYIKTLHKFLKHCDLPPKYKNPKVTSLEEVQNKKEAK